MRVFGLILALCLGGQAVNDVLQSVPVLLGAAGQVGGVKAGILDEAGKAVLIGQQGVGVVLDERPGLGKALLVHGVQRVVPLAERVLNGVGGAAGQVGLLGPLEQGSRCQHGFQGTAGNAGAPAQAGLKGIGRARDAEQRVLIKIRAQAGGVGLVGGAGDALAGRAGRAVGRGGSGAGAAAGGGVAASQKAEGQPVITGLRHLMR